MSNNFHKLNYCNIYINADINSGYGKKDNRKETTSSRNQP